MTLETEFVGRRREQQVFVVIAVSVMARVAALHENGLVVHSFLAEIGNVTVAAQANANRIRLGKERLLAGLLGPRDGAERKKSPAADSSPVRVPAPPRAAP